MRRKPRRQRNDEPKSYPKATHPNLTKSQDDKKPIKNLDTDLMQRLAHNTVLWCDHEGGTVLDKGSHPFSSHLEMENTNDKVQGTFHYQTSPYSNGNLSFAIWYDGKLVFRGYDVPGPVYQYPSEDIKVTTYISGPWEKFLLKKKYDELERHDR